MKIIAAATKGNFIVEMTSEEIARAAGYASDYAEAWAKANGGRTPTVGATIDVNAAYTFHVQLATRQEAAKNAAGVLRALAEMMENGLPSVVAPPVLSAATEGGAA